MHCSRDKDMTAASDPEILDNGNKSSQVVTPCRLSQNCSARPIPSEAADLED